MTFTFVLSCITLTLIAQSSIKVNCKGSNPTVMDFAWAALPSLNYEGEDEAGDRPWRALEYAMQLHRKGLPQEEGETLTIDSKNGYIFFECVHEEDQDHIFRLEVCCWNESDGKHKLIAFNNLASYTNGKPCLTETSGMDFYRYNNATKTMVACEPPGFEIDYYGIYELPRMGKDIIYTKWNDDGSTNRMALKWNGRQFKF